MKKSILFFLILALLTGCSAGKEEVNHTGSRESVAAFFAEADFSPAEWKKRDPGFLQGERYALSLDTEKEQFIVAYEYASPAAAAEDAAYLQGDGFGYDREGEAVLVEWIATPHFYLYENLILKYIGDEASVLQVLEANFGPQVAGSISSIENMIPALQGGEDNWGLMMDMRFLSAGEFEMVFRHDPERMTEQGKLTTGPEYELRVITKSDAFGHETISFEEYMQGLGYDYAAPELAWDAALYTIAQDGETVLYGNFDLTYGRLPAGEYVICKEIWLEREDGEVLKKVYTAHFAVADE